LDEKHLSDLRLLPGRFEICHLSAGAEVPASFFSATRTADELSVVCAEGLAPEGALREEGWRILQVAGPLDFSLTGVLAAIATPLAAAGVSIFAISTFNTDYVLVKEENVAKAMEALRAAGHRVS
jgi:uncharacterized protein